MAVKYTGCRPSSSTGSAGGDVVGATVGVGEGAGTAASVSAVLDRELAGGAVDVVVWDRGSSLPSSISATTRAAARATATTPAMTATQRQPRHPAGAGRRPSASEGGGPPGPLPGIPSDSSM